MTNAPLFTLAAAAVLALALGRAPAADRAVEIVAHRGESADAPENTMAAFKLAWERDVDAIELDVHLTKDGQLILCHDPDTERTAGAKHAIKDSLFADLRLLDAGRWKGPQWAGEKLPTLDEVLATVPETKRCYIEIKVGPEAVPAVARAVKASGKKPGQLAVISFKADTVAASKRELPDIPAYYLASFKQDKATKAWTPTAEKLIDEAKAIHADGLDLSYKGPIDAEFARKVKAAGLGFYVWTVDELDVAKKFIDFGAASVTTNKAGWLKKQLAR